MYDGLRGLDSARRLVRLCFGLIELTALGLFPDTVGGLSEVLSIPLTSESGSLRSDETVCGSELDSASVVVTSLTRVLATAAARWGRPPLAGSTPVRSPGPASACLLASLAGSLDRLCFFRLGGGSEFPSESEAAVACVGGPNEPLRVR